MASKKNSSAYARAGVDIVKADQFVSSISKIVQSTFTRNHKKNLAKGIGGYASLYKINKNQWIAASTDGVGTKLKLAFEMNRHDTVGIDLVAMSVNDLVCTGAKPLFFLDYFATGKLNLKTSNAVLRGIAEGCRQGHLALVGGETAEMPGMYNPGEYDLAGFAVGIVSRDELIANKDLKPGDVLIGFESSGPHSNGFSLIRKLLRNKSSDRALMNACLEPTRIYVDLVSALQARLGKKLKGLAHITGSGFLNIPRIHEGMNYDILLPDSFELPKVFEELKARGKLSWKELYTTFNMGIGLVAAVDPRHASQALHVASAFGIKAHRIGNVTRAKRVGKPKVRVCGLDFEILLDY